MTGRIRLLFLCFGMLVGADYAVGQNMVATGVVGQIEIWNYAVRYQIADSYWVARR